MLPLFSYPQPLLFNLAEPRQAGLARGWLQPAEEGMHVERHDVQRLRQLANAALRNPFQPGAVEAVAALAKAEPRGADNWFNLGYVQRIQGEFVQALESYERAIQLGVRGAHEVYLNRSVILSEFMDDPEAACAELFKALSIAPDFDAAWLNLALLAEDGGNVEVAREAYASLLRHHQHHPMAVARIARLLDPIAGIDLVRSALGFGNFDADLGVELWSSLAYLLDRVGDYNAAFDAVLHAKHFAKTLIPADKRYDPDASDKMVGALVAEEIPAIPADDGAAVPVFVCGMFRSGSTLLEALLGRHSSITSCGEREALPRLARDFRVAPVLGGDMRDRLTNMRRQYRRSLAHLNIATPLFTDKRPDNIQHMVLAKAMFANARMLVTSRHPLDNLVSCFLLNFDIEVPYAVDLDHICHWMVKSRDLALAWQARWPDHVQTVAYEALVTKPEAELKSVLDGLGLPWEARCLDSGVALPATRTPSSIDIRQPIYQRSVSRWRNYACHIEPQIEFCLKAGLLESEEQ